MFFQYRRARRILGHFKEAYAGSAGGCRGMAQVQALIVAALRAFP